MYAVFSESPEGLNIMCAFFRTCFTVYTFEMDTERFAKTQYAREQL